VDRYWLITWTCYGRRLPGDRRGFVGNVREPDGTHVCHNTPGTPPDADLPGLEAWVREHMRGEPVSLGRAEADAVLAQYQETARVRGWRLEAASVMNDHTHLVVGACGDPDPDHLRRTFQSWATRAVKTLRPLPPNGTFWTAKGSERKLEDESALAAAVVYVTRKQPDPLATWWAAGWQDALDGHDRSEASRAPEHPASRAPSGAG